MPNAKVLNRVVVRYYPIIGGGYEPLGRIKRGRHFFKGNKAPPLILASPTGD